MADGLYESDALAWSDQQADLLRRLAAGERVNDAVDWSNVIEEVQDVGRSELRSCQSLLRQALTHLLKLHAWPASHASAHWQDEVMNFIDDAENRFAPSMRQHIDLADLYRRSLKRVRAATDDAGEPRFLPETCPFALDDLLDPNTDARTLVLKLGSA